MHPGESADESIPATTAPRGFAWVRLLRPLQWIKNLFCLAGVIFAGKAGHGDSLTAALLAFIAFCAVSSFTYVINDFLDRREDAKHPLKRHRPIASGAISPAGAMVIAGLCLAIAVGCAWMLPRGVALVVGLYLVLTTTYSFALKRLVLLDVMAIAAGFILRLFAGTEAVRVPASAWILLCTFFLAMFLGFAKRRAELQLLGHSATRAVLESYTPGMLERLCYVFATLTIAAYAIFTVNVERTLVLTCPPVIFGILRYLWLAETHADEEQIEIVLVHDRPIRMAILIWFGLYVAVLYGGLRLPIQ